MVRRFVQPRRLIATASLLAASVALHAVVVSGLAGRLGGGVGGKPAPADPAPVEVALLAPPPPPPRADPMAGAKGATTTPSPAVVPRRVSPRPPSKPTAASPPPDPVPTMHAAAPGESPVGADDAEPSGSDTTTLASSGPRGGEDAAEATVQTATQDGGSGESKVPDPATSAAAGVHGSPTDVAVAPGQASGASRPPHATHPALPPLPPSQRHRFRVFWGDYTEERSVARLEYHLVHDGARYEIRTAAEAEGLISLVYSGTLSQASVGRLGPDGLEPLRYTEQRGRRPERTVAFDPVAHRLTPNGGRDAPVAMPPGTQDRLSVFYQLGLLARAEPGRFVAGAVRELPVATMRDVRIERFEVVGDETLPAPGGPIRALHLRRPPPPGTDDPRIDLWLGYDFQMLPVRLRVEDAGRRVLDQVIERGG